MNLYIFLDNYISYLTAERGASPHTIDAYNRDIMGFIKYLEENSFTAPERENVEGYMGDLRTKGKKASFRLTRPRVARHTAN